MGNFLKQEEDRQEIFHSGNILALGLDRYS